MRLAVFTHVIHQEKAGSYYAYSPYVREMNIWIKYVKEVDIIAPVAQTPKGQFSLNDCYHHAHINFTKIPSFDLLNFWGSVKAVFRIPLIILKIAGAMKRADHLHLRCPGNIGLLACICQIFFPTKLKTAKYAGNWDPKAKQPWSYRLQKWILSNTFLTRNMKVLVYGNWKGHSKNILPFFTASFYESELQKIGKDFITPYKFLYVGNLVPGKQPLFALQLVESLIKRNIKAELHVYGDGEMKSALKNKAENKSYIHLYGNQPLQVLKFAYQDSHFLILASKSEGWPKALAEAMFFGCIPVAKGVSCVPWMLGGGSRGILISEKEQRGEKRENRVNSGQRTPPPPVRVERTENSGVLINGTADRIIKLLNDPEEMRRMSMEAQDWSQEYTLERFEEAIKEVLAF